MYINLNYIVKKILILKFFIFFDNIFLIDFLICFVVYFWGGYGSILMVFYL